jgi:hypothetical protein
LSFFETVVAIGPIVGLALAVGALRRGCLAIAIAVLLASIAFAGTVAVAGNRRPIVGFLAFSFLALSMVAGEKKNDALALACFSAAFVTMMIAAMYT